MPPESQPPAFRLGIIGGCLSHQPGMGVSALYHRRLDEMLRASHGTRLDVTIDRHFGLSFRERLLTLLEKNSQLDAVLLHLRITFVFKAALFASQVTDGRRQYYLHPFLFRPNQYGWQTVRAPARSGLSAAEPVRAAAPDEDPLETPVPYKQVLGIRLRDVNLLAGMLTGLDRWAIRDELHMLAAFQEECRQRGIRPIVLGPTPSTQFRTETLLWRNMNRILARRLPAMGLPSLLIEELTTPDGAPMLKGDHIHVSEAGHRYVAQGLYPIIVDLLPN